MENKRLFDDFPPVSSDDWKKAIHKILKGKDYHDTLLWKTREGVDIEPFYTREVKDEKNRIKIPYSFKKNGHLIGFTLNNEPSLESQINIAKKHGATAFKIFWPKNGVNSIQEILDKIGKANLVQFNFDGFSADEIILLFENWNNIEFSNIKNEITLGFDPLNNYLKSGIWENSPKEVCSKYLEYINFFKSTPFKQILVDGAIFQNAGSTLTQELGLTLSMIVEYLKWLGADKKSIGNLHKLFHINFCVGPDFNLEICKIAAFKQLWINLMQAYGLENREIQFPLITVETAVWNKTNSDSYNNLLRLTSEIMSASIGGADCIYANNFDATFNLPNELSQRLSLNLHLLLKHEASIDLTNDKIGGSYYYEEVTNKLGKASWELFQGVEGEGGLIEYAESGKLFSEICTSRDRKQKDFDDQKMVLVGTNKYLNKEEEIPKPLRSEDFISEKTKKGSYALKPFRVAEKIENQRIVDK